MSKNLGYMLAGVGVIGLGIATYFIIKKDKPTTEETVLPPVVTKPTITTTVKTTPVKTSGFIPPVVITPKMPVTGQKIYSGATGANAYNTKSTSIGQLYKYYNTNEFIGTYLGTDGVYTKIIVQEPNILTGISAKTVWAITTNLKF